VREVDRSGDREVFFPRGDGDGFATLGAPKGEPRLVGRPRLQVDQTAAVLAVPPVVPQRQGLVPLRGPLLPVHDIARDLLAAPRGMPVQSNALEGCDPDRPGRAHGRCRLVRRACDRNGHQDDDGETESHVAAAFLAEGSGAREPLPDDVRSWGPMPRGLPASVITIVPPPLSVNSLPITSAP